MAMTVDELETLAGIAAAVRRMETAIAEQNKRLQTVEEGMAAIITGLRIAKWALGAVGGFAGLAGLAVYFANH